MFKPEDFDIIDMHTHPFIAPEMSIARFGTPRDMEEFIREMNKVGIYKFAGSVVQVCRDGVDFDTIRMLNREALRLRDAYPDIYTPGVHIHGAYVQESCEELQKMHAEGVKLVGELVPYFLGPWGYGDPCMMTMCKEAENLGMTLNLHGGTEEELAPVLTACPRLNIILAHPGDGDSCKTRFDFVSRYKNLYIDISGTGLFRWGMLRYGVDVCGAEKILFGSDMPVCSPGMNLFGALSENLSFEEFNLVLGDNFRRLLDL